MSLLSIASIAYLLVSQDSAEPKDLNNLPVEEAYQYYAAEFPPDGIKHIRFSARRALSTLYYDVDPSDVSSPLSDVKTSAAVREFESRAGLTPDGILSANELTMLTKLADLESQIHVHLGAGLYVSTPENSSDYVLATGTWHMNDIAWPLNRSEIECSRYKNTCTDNAIYVDAPKLHLPDRIPSMTSYLVFSHTDEYQITSWSNGFIDAVAFSSCRRVRMTINTNTQSVTQITEDINSDGCALPYSDARLPPIDGVRVATLIDTSTAQTRYRDDIREQIDRVKGPIWTSFISQASASDPTR